MNNQLSKKAIDNILKHYDWEKTQRTMKALNWTWHDTKHSPTIPQMKKMVKMLFKDTLKHLKDKTEKDKNGCPINESWYVESGGFRVTLWDRERLELAFIVEHCDSGRE